MHNDECAYLFGGREQSAQQHHHMQLHGETDCVQLWQWLLTCESLVCVHVCWFTLPSECFNFLLPPPVKAVAPYQHFLSALYGG